MKPGRRARRKGRADHRTRRRPSLSSAPSAVGSHRYCGDDRSAYAGCEVVTGCGRVKPVVVVGLIHSGDVVEVLGGIAAVKAIEDLVGVAEALASVEADRISS